MAKIIKMTQELQAQCRKEFYREFEEAISKGKLVDGKLSFSKSFGTVDQKAQVYFSEMAWLKMTTLLREFSKEVAWHATAYRVPGDVDAYFIGDILVYPQTVTPSSVDMDTEKYAMWIMENEDKDERFSNIRAQMHSHVNMAVSPSSVDITHQEEILHQLEDDGFYIFMIWNKSLNVNIRIFDMQKNLMFENTDVTWSVLDGDIGLSAFLAEAKKQVVDKATYSGYNYGYGNNYCGGSGPYDPTSSSYGKSGSSGSGKQSETKSKKKDKKKTKFSGKNACDNQLTIVTESGEPFDMTDPYGYLDGRFQIT